VTIVGSADFAINDPATYAPACVNMKALGTNVIMLVSFSDDIPQIMKVCKEKGFGGKGHVWIVADAAKASTAFEAGVASGQRPEETAALLNGMLQLIPQSKGAAGHTRVELPKLILQRFRIRKLDLPCRRVGSSCASLRLCDRVCDCHVAGHGPFRWGGGCIKVPNGALRGRDRCCRVRCERRS
jgi:hypothetical protein